MRIFWKKCKNRLSVEGSAFEPPLAFGGSGLRPRTPALLLPTTIATLLSSFLALNAVYYPSIMNNFFYFQIFAPIFYFKLCSFC